MSPNNTRLNGPLDMERARTFPTRNVSSMLAERLQSDGKTLAKCWQNVSEMPVECWQNISEMLAERIRNLGKTYAE